MPSQQKSRSGAIDAVRVIGITAVVAGHISTEGIILPLIYTWHVPVFFVLVGYFWSWGRTIRQEAHKRLETLIVPAVFWGVGIYAVFSLVSVIRGTFTGELPLSAYMAYWFAPALFLSAVLLRVLDRFPAWISWVVALVALAASYLFGEAMAGWPLYVGAALPSLVFVLIGRVARRWRDRLSLGFAVTALVIAEVLIWLGVSRPIDIKSVNFGTPVLSVMVAAIISVALIVICDAVIPRLPSFVSRAATELAYSGWAVILGHAAFILLLRALGLPPVIVFIGALSLPWLIGLIALRTPASLIVTGTAFRPKPRGRGRRLWSQQTHVER